MSQHITRINPSTWLAIACTMWLAAVGSALAGAPADPKVPPKKQAPAAPAAIVAGAASDGQSYVGEAKCLECHDDQRAGYEGSPHHRVADPRSPAARQGCESCHGPGSKHVDDPGSFTVKNFNKLPAKDVSATCTTCHNRGEHALWDGSQHDSRNLSCVTCHSVHAYKSEHQQLK